MLHDITLSGVSQLIALGAPLCGCLLMLFRLGNRFGRLERQAAYNQEDSEIIFMCLRGCLEGLIENGADGAVKEALKKLNEYMGKKAAGISGKGL